MRYHSDVNIYFPLFTHYSTTTCKYVTLLKLSPPVTTSPQNTPNYNRPHKTQFPPKTIHYHIDSRKLITIGANFAIETRATSDSLALSLSLCALTRGAPGIRVMDFPNNSGNHFLFLNNKTRLLSLLAVTIIELFPETKFKKPQSIHIHWRLRLNFK